MDKEIKEQQSKDFLAQDYHRVNFKQNRVLWKQSPALFLFDLNLLSTQALPLLPDSELIQFQDLILEKR